MSSSCDSVRWIGKEIDLECLNVSRKYCYMTPEYQLYIARGRNTIYSCINIFRSSPSSTVRGESEHWPHSDDKEACELNVTTKNFWVLRKQCHDSSDDYKFPLTTMRPSVKRLLFLCSYYWFLWSGPNPSELRRNGVFFVLFCFVFNVVVLCNDSNIILCLQLLFCTLACNINANGCATLAYRK